MTSHLKTLTALAFVSVLLTACGGGGGGGSSNDDAPAIPDPSTKSGVLTVSDSTAAGINGVYGSGELALTEVFLKDGFGTSEPQLCVYKFTGAEKVGSTETAFGEITYRPTSMGLHFAFLTFGQREYSSGDSADTAVDRPGNLVRFNSKTLTATDGSKDTLKLTAVIPMHINRPDGC